MPPFIYAANRINPGAVTVIDASTNQIIKTILDDNQKGAFVPAVLTTPGQLEQVWVSNADSNTVSIIFTLTNSVFATLPTGRLPVAIAFARICCNVFAYITNNVSNDVTVYNTCTRQLITTIPVGRGPNGAAATPDGTKVYVANRDDGNVSVISTATNSVTNIISLGGPGNSLFLDTFAFIPGVGVRAYVADSNASNPNITVIDTLTDAVVAQIPIGKNPRSVCISPDGTIGFSTNSADGTVTAFDPRTNTVITTLNLLPNSNPQDCSFTPDGQKVYVTEPGTSSNVNKLAVIDVATLTVLDNIDGGTNPRGIDISSGNPVPSFCCI